MKKITRLGLLPGLLLCLIGAGRAAHGQELGRLFTSPEERAALERVRHAGKRAPEAALNPTAGPVAAQAVALEGATPPAATQRVRIPVEGQRIIVVNGTVRRSGSGRVTTWIDSVPHTGSGQLGGGAALAQDRHAGKVGLILRSGQRVTLKPGQTVDVVSGRVAEAYQPVFVRTPRRGAEPIP